MWAATVEKVESGDWAFCARTIDRGSGAPSFQRLAGCDLAAVGTHPYAGLRIALGDKSRFCENDKPSP
jgi:hypothetical protein